MTHLDISPLVLSTPTGSWRRNHTSAAHETCVAIETQTEPCTTWQC